MQRKPQVRLYSTTARRVDVISFGLVARLLEPSEDWAVLHADSERGNTVFTKFLLSKLRLCYRTRSVLSHFTWVLVGGQHSYANGIRMSLAPRVAIDLSEKFPDLGEKAPIAEAVIAVTSEAEAEWDDAHVESELKKQLPDYPVHKTRHQVEYEIKAQSPDKPLTQTLQKSGSMLRFESADSSKVSQFSKDLFTHSRLNAYTSWTEFCDEALRLWEIHKQYARCALIQRLGVRYINKIPLPAANPEEYFNCLPVMPEGFDGTFANFVHQDTLNVPGHSYAIRLVKTIDLRQTVETPNPSLILDIDVITLEPFAIDGKELKRKLLDMRWLKNKVFFGILTEKAVEGYK